jgi:hypothetical protein
MSYTNGLDKPSDYFETKLHNGTGVAKTLAYDFEVDLFWTKMRNDAYPHGIFDVVRGNNAYLRTNVTNAEISATNTVSFGNASGVTLGSDSSNYGINQALNDSSQPATYVGWGWKANGTGVSNTDGSITSTVSANTTSGFSIVSFTGTGSTATVGHGLGVTPKMFIVKNRSIIETWRPYHVALGGGQALALNDTNATDTDSAYWNNTEPTSSVFTVGTNSGTNGSGNSMIAYCFAEKSGYSSMGKYTGNGNADGTFVYTGFRPAWLMLKRTDTTAFWRLYDNKRNTFNIVDKRIAPNDSGAETTADDLDFLSNGFKQRGTSGANNASGGSYIYMAFAENPFVTSTGIPTTAR